MPNYESFEEWSEAASKSIWCLSEKSKEAIWNSENRGDLITAIPHIRKETRMRINDFTETFSDTASSFDYQSGFIKRYGLNESFLSFNRGYPLTLDEKFLEGVVIYDNFPWTKELAEVKNGKIILNPSKKFGIDIIDDFEEKIYECRCRLAETDGKDEKAAGELRETRRNMEKEKTKLRKRAKEILGSIANNKFGSNTLEAYVWRKNIKSMPTYDGFNCSAFLGYHNKHTKNIPLLSYMSNPAVQLIVTKLNGKEAIAITDAAKDMETNEKILIVDSLESSSHMLARKDISNAVDSAITDYAKNSGFDRLVYSLGGIQMNSAPREFLKNMNKKHKKEEIRFKPLNNRNFYSDMLYKNVDIGCIVEL